MTDGTSRTTQLLLITNFVKGKPQRMYLDPHEIICAIATGSGQQSGLELLFRNGEVVQTSIWDTQLPFILAKFGIEVVEFDRRNDVEALESDMFTRFGIEPYSKKQEDQPASSGFRSKADKARDTSPADTDRVGPGSTCFICEDNFEHLDAVDIDGESQHLCATCLDDLKADEEAA